MMCSGDAHQAIARPRLASSLVLEMFRTQWIFATAVENPMWNELCPRRKQCKIRTVTPKLEDRKIKAPPVVLIVFESGGYRRDYLCALAQRLEDRSGAPRPMKMGTIASPWRYDLVLDSTLSHPLSCPALPARSDEKCVRTCHYSVSTSSRLIPRPARRLLRACSIRRRNRRCSE